MSVVKSVARRRLTMCVILCMLACALETPTRGADKAAVDHQLDAIRQYQRGRSRAALFAVEEAIRTSQQQPDVRKHIANRLAGMLTDDVTLDGKLFICRQLWYLSADDSAATLSRMLADEATADMACYAIASDPTPAADKALRDALLHLRGAPLARVVNLIGQRRDTASVGVLAKLAKEQDTAVVGAAVAALGKIGGPDAAHVLGHVHEQAPAGLRAAAADALLECAEGYVAEGKKTEAGAIYRGLCRDDDLLLRRAAMQGLSRVAVNDAVPLAIAALRDKDRMIQQTAIGCIRTMEGDEVAAVLAKELPKLDTDGQVMLLAALADKGGPCVLETIQWAAASPNEKVKTAALAALAKAGDASCVDLLIGAMEAPEYAAASAKALKAVPGAGVEAVIVRRMRAAPAALKLQLIDVLHDRNAAGAAASLLAEAAGPDKEVRKAAWHALGRLGSPGDLPSLLKELVRLPDDHGRPEAERSAGMVAQRIADPERRADAVAAALAATQDTAARCSLLRVLGQVGNDAALEALTRFVQDDNAAVCDTAVRALTEQSSTKALDVLAKLFTQPARETHRILALRGYVRLLQRDTDLIEREKATCYEKAMAAAAGANEKRLITGGLSTVRHVAALELVRRYLDDADVRAEAKLAAAKIREALSRPPEGYTAIFDGKTFAGWEGNLDVFRIEDGAIVGGTLKARIARNEFLCTQKEYGDFELRLKVRLLGDPAGANAGIQIRSRRVPNHHEMSGYQADMGQRYWGCLYDESRRNRVLAQAVRPELDKVLVPDGWNDYIIRCEGKRIRLWINDYPTVDYTEPEDGIEQTGLIGLQIHGGPPAEAWYKDVFLRRIP